MKIDCYFYNPVQDMNASIPCCSFFNILGYCPCENSNFDCPFSVRFSLAREIILKFVSSRFEKK